VGGADRSQIQGLARVLKDLGGIPVYGNQRSEGDTGCGLDASNPDYR